MRRKLMTVLSILMVLSLSATTLYAANVRITSVSFSLGSLIADGTMDGFDPNQSAKVNLLASGTAKVLCFDGQGRTVGGGIVNTRAEGVQSIQADSAGLSGFHVETGPTQLVKGGFTCPPNSTPEIRHESWSAAIITVKDPAAQLILLTQSYRCVQKSDTEITCYPN